MEDQKKYEFSKIKQNLEEATPIEIIRWAVVTFEDKLIATSSFQTHSIPLLFFISQEAPKIPVVFIDTGFHFSETIEFRDHIVDLFGLNLKVVEPQIKGQDFLRTFGPVYNQSPDACCFYNKVAPFHLFMKNYQAWISGIRRDQTINRKQSLAVEQHPFLPYHKINPVIGWSAREIDLFIDEHNLPRHPLWEKGYRSIGCKLCTSPVSSEEDDRAGRWSNFDKTECGLHIESKSNTKP